MTANTKQAEKPVQKERRVRPRTSVPSVTVRLDGETYIPEDWGLRGCRVPGYGGDLQPGDNAKLELFLNVDQEHEGLAIQGKVVRHDADAGSLAIEFIDLTARDIVDFCDAVDSTLGAGLSQD